jgi:K+ transport systems, NAD-binding component
MKIIIAGAGEVGSHLAKMLSSERYNNLTIIDNDESRLNKLAEIADVVTVQGKPTSIETLKQAGAENADLFIAVSPASEQDVNLISAMLAKKMGSQKVTARINNDEYQTHENKLLFTELGIDLLFYPEKIAAYEIIDLLKQSGTTEFMEFSRGKLQMVVFRLDDGAPLINKSVYDFQKDSLSLYQTVAISRNNTTIIPTMETKLLEKDLVFVICTREGVKHAMSFSGKNDIEIKNLMIVGGGRIGEILAKKMEGSVEK